MRIAKKEQIFFFDFSAKEKIGLHLMYPIYLHPFIKKIEIRIMPDPHLIYKIKDTLEINDEELLKEYKKLLR